MIKADGCRGVNHFVAGVCTSVPAEWVVSAGAVRRGAGGCCAAAAARPDLDVPGALGVTFLTGFILPFGRVAAAASSAPQANRQVVHAQPPFASARTSEQPRESNDPHLRAVAAVRIARPTANPLSSRSHGGAKMHEIPSLRTRTSRTYDLGNGDYMAEIYEGSINFRNASGKWQSIDDTLVPTTVSWKVRCSVWRRHHDGSWGSNPLSWCWWRSAIQQRPADQRFERALRICAGWCRIRRCGVFSGKL